MTITIADLKAANNPLAAHYSQFRVGERLLLTGHSHQAWPDCSLGAHTQAWQDAALHVDHKWARAMEQAEAVRKGFRRLLGEPDAELALAQNTHELVMRFISALDLSARPRIVTSDGEFHTLRRQLTRLKEEGVELVVVPQYPANTFSERLAKVVNKKTAAVMVSQVFFNSARIVEGFHAVAQQCDFHGVHLLVDMYHSLNVLPVSVHALGLDNAFIVGGGYKYCQLGEGNCFLRVPPNCELRPVNTGWYAEFDLLAEQPDNEVHYGKGGARFAGSTYDPTSHYRAARVFAFFEEQGLTPALLRQISQHQIAVLATAFEALNLPEAEINLDHALALSERAGFLVVQTPRAMQLSELMVKQGVFTDARGAALRFGPAPYLADHQLRSAMQALGEAYSQL
ncbi:aminotransferase class V-fold PLP-dependent enzyme [Simiduia sp. 21SJ11W-1]|uniref:aminotransferase class V-fold PLP-dependent enzyme n=1 Tax=Simiduia sp. 21SJ11W-1 TaxID=2909669 RepID=UPI00209D5952|nr:aminotransferase class V-fold PLP-dependent enzyme [Simiduia sp. 21SJ11W-1]UTA48737.1 aminotransferase class V-fold PLP-dependent enzyme [Simiduia sp. 21SJ11W-1]